MVFYTQHCINFSNKGKGNNQTEYTSENSLKKDKYRKGRIRTKSQSPDGSLRY